MCVNISILCIRADVCVCVYLDITSVEETNVVGVAVRCEESDDDSENLLSNELW